MRIFFYLKCFNYDLLFDFIDFQTIENELVTSKVRFLTDPLFDM